MRLLRPPYPLPLLWGRYVLVGEVSRGDMCGRMGVMGGEEVSMVEGGNRAGWFCLEQNGVRSRVPRL